MESYYHGRICVYAYEHMKHKGRGVKVLSVVSRKGGVGETTLATTLAVEASRDGKKTVMFDLDSRASASFWKHTREDESLAIIAAPAAVLDVTRTLDLVKHYGRPYGVV